MSACVIFFKSFSKNKSVNCNHTMYKAFFGKKIYKSLDGRHALLQREIINNFFKKLYLKTIFAKTVRYFKKCNACRSIIRECRFKSVQIMIPNREQSFKNYSKKALSQKSSVYRSSYFQSMLSVIVKDNLIMNKNVYYFPCVTFLYEYRLS